MKTTLKELHLPNKDGGYESLYIEDFATAEGLATTEELNAISERVDIINERVGKLYYAVLKGKPIDLQLPLYIESLEDINTITFAGYRLGNYASQMEYSTDLIVWHSLVGVKSLTLNKYSKVYFHCIDGHIQGNLGELFSTRGSINVGGNLNITMNDCISNPENSINPTLIERAYCGAFAGTKVVDASKLSLPATTLSSGCYQDMFQNCHSLTTAPALPATTLASGCYQDMFYECHSLTTAPALPATTLSSGCYSSMFRDCTSLTTAPALPATTLASGCYTQMFRDCTSLTTAPKLPATILTGSCYYSMFYNCISLTTAPELPATKLASRCYTQMFDECHSLTTAPPELPATTLETQCYQYMFSNCTSLTTAPELPATTLAEYCYHSMFQNCRSLTTAPALPATTLADWCYYHIFQGCSNLSSITCLATDISADYCTPAWVRGVASSGTFTRAIGMDGWTTGEDGIPTGWAVQDYVPNNYVTFTAEEDSTIGLTSLSSNQKLLYSKDQSTWSLMDTTTSISLASGESAYIAGMLSANNTSSDYTRFKMVGKITASGNCNALWNYIDVNAALKDYCGYRMFQGCSSLTSIPELPATTLAFACYRTMFYGCTSLTTAPALPATILTGSCYSYMFYGCTALTTSPELPATTLATQCYDSMFYNCSKLSSITCHATDISASNCTNQWVKGVAASGTFYKAASTEWTDGDSGIPTDWLQEVIV